MSKLFTLLLLGCACAAPAENAAASDKTVDTRKDNAANDLNTDASTYYDRYSDYGARGYPSGYGGAVSYGVTGYGTVDDRSLGGYDNYGYDRGYPGSYGSGGYAGNSGYDGYRGGYGASNIGYGASNGGYGASNAGYGSYAGYGGYGGYGGNGGVNSYYGYNNPGYQGYGHLGYGYYNKRPGYGNIYNSGITPSLVTGYRGYSRK